MLILPQVPLCVLDDLQSVSHRLFTVTRQIDLVVRYQNKSIPTNPKVSRNAPFKHPCSTSTMSFARSTVCKCWFCPKYGCAYLMISKGSFTVTRHVDLIRNHIQKLIAIAKLTPLCLVLVIALYLSSSRLFYFTSEPGVET